TALEADGADVLAVKFDITQRAKKPPTRCARHARSLRWMIKTTGFPFDKNGFARHPGLHRSKQRGKCVYLDRSGTKRALNEVAGVDRTFWQRQMAFGTCDSRRTHLRLSYSDH